MTFKAPRSSNYMGMKDGPTLMEKDTWIEPESLCYPGGGMHRRARALCPDGKLRVVVCGLPDTAFSIPARGGYLTLDERVVEFHPYKPKKVGTDPAQ